MIKKNVRQIWYIVEPCFQKFYVKENGNGIAKEYFYKIFVAFKKVENYYKSTNIRIFIVK